MASHREEKFGPEGWQFNQDGTLRLYAVQSPLIFTPSSGSVLLYTIKLPSGIAEHFAGGLKVVVRGPRLVQVTAVVTGDIEYGAGNERTSVVVTTAAEVTDMAAVS